MIEVEIFVRYRDEHHNPVGKPGHETLQYKLLEKLPLKDRKRVATRIAEAARKIITEETSGSPS